MVCQPARIDNLCPILDRSRFRALKAGRDDGIHQEFAASTAITPGLNAQNSTIPISTVDVPGYTHQPDGAAVYFAACTNKIFMALAGLVLYFVYIDRGVRLAARAGLLAASLEETGKSKETALDVGCGHLCHPAFHLCCAE